MSKEVLTLIRWEISVKEGMPSSSAISKDIELSYTWSTFIVQPSNSPIQSPILCSDKWSNLIQTLMKPTLYHHEVSFYYPSAWAISFTKNAFYRDLMNTYSSFKIQLKHAYEASSDPLNQRCARPPWFSTSLCHWTHSIIVVASPVCLFS